MRCRILLSNSKYIGFGANARFVCEPRYMTRRPGSVVDGSVQGAEPGRQRNG